LIGCRKLDDIRHDTVSALPNVNGETDGIEPDWACNGEVIFSYRDRKNKDRKKTMTLQAHEFIRRFLLHVIPKGIRLAQDVE
jgi:hypothetical protein